MPRVVLWVLPLLWLWPPHVHGSIGPDDWGGASAEAAPVREDRDTARDMAQPRAEGGISVRAYGAKGDGVSDDTAAIQRAAVVAVDEGKALYLPAGRYRTAGKLATDVTIHILGDGPDLTVIDVNTYRGTVFEVRERSEIRDLTILGDGPSYGATAIATAPGSQWWLSCVRNVHFKSIGAAIVVTGAWGASLENIFCANVGSGVRLGKFNGGRIDRLYVNKHVTGPALLVSDSRAWTVNSLVTENNAAAGCHRVHLQGCECGTIDGWYTEGAQGAGSHDIFFGGKSGVGATENIVVNNAWMNSGGTPGVAPIGIAAGTNITLSNFHWHTPGGGRIPCYIDTSVAGGRNTAVVRNWIREGGDGEIPLANDHDHVVCEGTFTFEFLTTADGARRLPFVADNPVEFTPGEAFDAWIVTSGGYHAVAYGVDPVRLHVPKAGVVRIPVRGVVTSSSGAQPFFRLGTANLTNGRTWEGDILSTPASGRIGECNIYAIVDAGWNDVQLGISREQGGSGRNTWTPLVNPAGTSPSVVKTLVRTISVDGDALGDYRFRSETDAREQSIVMPDVLPPYASLLCWQVRCLDTVTNRIPVRIEVGVADGGGKIGAGVASVADEVIGMTSMEQPQLAATNAARSIYVSGTPDANWSTLDAGRWAVALTYVDYGDAYSRMQLEVDRGSASAPASGSTSPAGRK